MDIIPPFINEPGVCYSVEGENNYNHIQVLHRGRRTGIIRRYPNLAECHFGLDKDHPACTHGYFYFKVVRGQQPELLTFLQAERALFRFLRRILRRRPIDRDLVSSGIPDCGPDVIQPPHTYPFLRQSTLAHLDFEYASDYEP